MAAPWAMTIVAVTAMEAAAVEDRAARPHRAIWMMKSPSKDLTTRLLTRKGQSGLEDDACTKVIIGPQHPHGPVRR
ncbi:hypothetical protein So717_18660 [Roseobacter cerasinus]|uniref:Uncharacterized protein n=1 Tax=Roseobacter cerasinus TaxID=2602289 RepID=A0A640VPE5_9RHOB|nr:hypothetical protein So717_18660 [Roseobacter cerasinus]